MTTTQTRHGIPPEFLAATAGFVQVANRLADSCSNEWVAAATPCASARFNAFAWLTRTDRPRQTFAQAVAQAVAHSASEYDKMLRDNVDEPTPVYRRDAAADG